VKLTPELIEHSRQYINPVRERELCLRGYKLAAVENLGVTFDQFDVIDFSDNDIRKLDGFPYFYRLKELLLHNNRINHIVPNLGANLPNVNTVMLTNNEIRELGDIEPLSTFPRLEYLSLLGNPVVHKPHYRLYLIYKCPNLRVLDFKRVREAERTAAKELFKWKKGKQVQQQIVKRTRTFVPGELVPLPGKKQPVEMPGGVRTLDDIKKIKEAIAKATSLEEVERLNQLLQSGQIPGQTTIVQQNGVGGAGSNGVGGGAAAANNMEVEEHE